MVDVLEVSGGRKVRSALTELPSSTQSAEKLAQPGVELGQALRGAGRGFDEMSSRLDQASIPAAQAEGLAAVGRDEQANATFEPRIAAFTGADRAYNAAGMAGAQLCRQAGHWFDLKRIHSSLSL